MKTAICILLLICTTTLAAQDLDCSKFKTGSFIMEDPNTGVNYISRNDSTQIEYLPKLGIKVELNAKWIDECTLELSLKDVIENPNNHPIREFILISKIIKTEGDSYVMESKATDSELTMVRKFTIQN